jgi:hypothetical protein
MTALPARTGGIAGGSPPADGTPSHAAERAPGQLGSGSACIGAGDRRRASVVVDLDELGVLRNALLPDGLATGAGLLERGVDGAASGDHEQDFADHDRA